MFILSKVERLFCLQSFQLNLQMPKIQTRTSDFSLLAGHDSRSTDCSGYQKTTTNRTMVQPPERNVHTLEV